ncbi:hypothetical protein BT93_B0527 [Corymbia citriodora subsp. variegata]|nr:hypothetical protein BT93_B0527 [Corymbia citriodora subsp. variegata]
MDDKKQKKVVPKGQYHDPRSAANVYLKCILKSIIELFSLGYAAFSLGYEQREKLHELSEHNLELSKLRTGRRRLVELRHEVEKSPIEGWHHAPVDQLSLEELKLYKRKYEELSKMFTQAIEERTTDSHGYNFDDPHSTHS